MRCTCSVQLSLMQVIMRLPLRCSSTQTRNTSNGAEESVIVNSSPLSHIDIFVTFFGRPLVTGSIRVIVRLPKYNRNKCNESRRQLRQLTKNLSVHDKLVIFLLLICGFEKNKEHTQCQLSNHKRSGSIAMVPRLSKSHLLQTPRLRSMNGSLLSLLPSLLPPPPLLSLPP